MKRELLVKSAQYWFDKSNADSFQRENALIQALNHTENALKYILGKVPAAKEIFDKQ